MRLLNAVLGCAAILLIAGCAGWAPYYVIVPIQAKIVDADTGEPIVGANVIAHWQLVVGGLDGPSDAGQLEVKETVTDKDGRFAFQGFSRAALPFIELRDDDPEIIIFKPGYNYLRLSNEYPGTDTPGIHRRWQLNGMAIKMKKMPADLMIFTRRRNPQIAYLGLRGYLESIVWTCEWVKIKKAIASMEAEHRRLKAISYFIADDLVGPEDLHKGCNTPDNTQGFGNL